MFSRKVTKSIAVGVMIVAVTVSGIGLGASSSSTGATSTTQTVAPSRGAAPSQAGTLITGAAAGKAKAAALAAGYKGTVDRVLKLSDGSYAVHFTANPSGPHDVFVSKDFKVTGAA
jgi:hypothetical protein